MASHQRVSWPQYFMRIAHLVAERSTCLRRRVGAVAVKDKRILATGYNGAPAGIPHCLESVVCASSLGFPPVNAMKSAGGFMRNRMSSSRLRYTAYLWRVPNFIALQDLV